MERVCPLLALVTDPRAAVDGVDAGHRCHADSPPALLDRATQAQLCLTAAHDRCERYLAFVARSGAVVPGRSSLAPGFASTRQLLAPQPAWRGIAGRASAASSAPVLVAGGAVLVVGIAAAAVAGGVIGSAPRPAALDATVSPTARPIETSTPTVRPTPTAIATPTPTATPAPTPVPATPVPATPVPTPAPQTYVVQAGDTLAAIAERFGTTTEALQQANGIADPNQIAIGQVLVIP